MVTICYTTSILQCLISTLYSLGKPAQGVCPAHQVGDFGHVFCGWPLRVFVPTICGSPLCCAEVWLVGLAGCTLPCWHSSLELEPRELTGDTGCGRAGSLPQSGLPWLQVTKQ